MVKDNQIPELQTVDGDTKSIQVMAIGDSQIVSGTSSTQSTAFTTNSVIRVSSLSDVRLAVGSDPTATTSDTLFPGGNVEYFRIGSNSKMAALNGEVNITLMI